MKHQTNVIEDETMVFKRRYVIPFHLKQQTEKQKKTQYVIIAIWEIDGKKQTKKNRPYTTLQSSREQVSKEWNEKKHIKKI